MEKISPFLWFDKQAEEAANFYVSLFPDSKIEAVERYGEAGPGPKGSVMTVAFRLAGQPFTALNGGPEFKFTPAVSFAVTCRDQAEIDSYWEKLGRGGQTSRCGWLQDRFGLSWQIVPANIAQLLRSPKAMKAMLGMDKLIIQRLEAAAKE